MRLKTRPKLRGGPALRWLLAGVWMAGIFYLSHQTAPLGAAPSSAASIVAHLGLYAGLAFLLYFALQAPAAEGPDGALFLAAVAFALAVLYGLTDELHQAFVPGRTASEADLALDAAGALVGVALATTARWAIRAGIRPSP